MKINDVLQALEQWAPRSLQDSYDNSGLIAGDRDKVLTKALICLDCIEAVIDEAIMTGCNLIISHHPIVFSGLKKITGETYPERVLIKAIKHDIIIYAIHTNLDNVISGVSKEMADRLGLENCRVLRPLAGVLKKLTFFVPGEAANKVRDAIFAAGAGSIGNYSECSFNVEGKGTFKPGLKSNPYSGSPDVRSIENEQRIEVIAPSWNQSWITSALQEAHPYEEIAFDWTNIENTLQDTGPGIVGEFPSAVSSKEFLRKIKDIFGGMVRHTNLIKRDINKVALCGGSGSFLLPDAIRAGADIFLTADFKYHQFFDAEEKIIIADIGHFESEQFTMDLILRYLNDFFPNFAGRLTEIHTNPIHYL